MGGTRAAGLRGEVRAALAIARKDLRILARYPLEAVNSVIQAIYQFLIPSLLLGATFLVGGRAIGLEQSAGTSDVAGFIILGMVVAYLVSAGFWGIGFSLKREMDQGTLEPAWLSPTARETFVVGRALSAFSVAGIGGLLAIALAVTLFGVRISPAVVVALPALLLGVLGVLGVAFVVCAFVLLVKEPTFFVDATDFVFSAASGVAFPITVLPGVLQLVSLALPTTYALDLLRTHALAARPLFATEWMYVALAALTAVSLYGGRAFFRWADDRVRRAGTLGHH